MVNIKLKDLVIVKWQDHCSYGSNSWTPAKALETVTPVNITTVGFVMQNTKDIIVVASTLDDDDYAAKGDLCIIKSCVKSIKKLKQ